MRRWFLRSPVALAAVLMAAWTLPQPAYAAPAPIVFDFEDGLQGWTLGGSAQRVQTQVLGGEWAIFGDGRSVGAGDASIVIEMDLTGIASISVEQFFVEGNEDNLAFFHTVISNDLKFFSLFPELDVIEPGNPSLRAVDVSSITGVTDVGFFWGFRVEVEDIVPPPIVAFIDNITFHPVPEPGTLALLAGSLVALVIARRRIV